MHILLVYRRMNLDKRRRVTYYIENREILFFTQRGGGAELKAAQHKTKTRSRVMVSVTHKNRNPNKRGAHVDHVESHGTMRAEQPPDPCSERCRHIGRQAGSQVG